MAWIHAEDDGDRTVKKIAWRVSRHVEFERRTGIGRQENFWKEQRCEPKSPVKCCTFLLHHFIVVKIYFSL